jgi:hypothetical protein
LISTSSSSFFVPPEISGVAVPARRITQQQSARVGNVSQYTTDGNVTGAAFDLFSVFQVGYVRHARAKRFERCQRIESRWVTANTEMRFFAVVCDPSDVTRREFGIEKTK